MLHRWNVRLSKIKSLDDIEKMRDLVLHKWNSKLSKVKGVILLLEDIQAMKSEWL